MSRYLPLYIFLFLSNVFLAQDAVYKIEFISNWSSTTHPTDYPTGSAHWSPLIGTTHKDAVISFQLGITATDGVEEVAETGATSIITQEISAMISGGLAYEIINGSGLGSGPGTITINNVSVDADFPYISLITMIAPSPDWVAMIGNQKLTDNSENWLQNISVDVYATDAGTDSGTTYIFDNADITPHINMSSLENMLPFSTQIIGTYKFTLEQVLSVPEEELSKAISIYPNPTIGKLSINNYSGFNLKKAEVFSINGRKLREISLLNNQKTISFNQLNNGMYFLRIYTDQGNLSKKLIIQD